MPQSCSQTSVFTPEFQTTVGLCVNRQPKISLHTRRVLSNYNSCGRSLATLLLALSATTFYWASGCVARCGWLGWFYWFRRRGCSHRPSNPSQNTQDSNNSHQGCNLQDYNGECVDQPAVYDNPNYAGE